MFFRFIAIYVKDGWNGVLLLYLLLVLMLRLDIIVFSLRRILSVSDKWDLATREDFKDIYYISY
jgi:hypothetical protein